jgi:hypothetical protein
VTLGLDSNALEVYPRAMTTKIHAMHASLDTFMPNSENESDVRNIAALEPDWATFTETGEKAMVQLVRDVAGEKYHVVNPDAGDITFIVRRDHKILDHGGPLAIPGKPGPAKLGGHGPRHNSFVQMEIGDDVVTHTGIHFVTKTLHVGGPVPERVRQQLKQGRLVGEQMTSFGKGRHLATGSGDLNSILPRDTALQDIFDEYGLTTTSEETGVMTGTHGDARLDYFWTFDADGRISVASMKVLKGHRFFSDHDPLDVWLDVAA